MAMNGNNDTNAATLEGAKDSKSGPTEAAPLAPFCIESILRSLSALIRDISSSLDALRVFMSLATDVQSFPL